MKLYFYVFEDNKIMFSECEVEEKPKSYTLKDKVRGFYGSRILKTEIGLKEEYDYKQIVIFDQRDDELAKQYLSDCLNKKIEDKKKEIDELMKKLKTVSEWEDNQ